MITKEERYKKVSEKLKGHTVSLETRIKISKKLIGLKRSKEQIEKYRQISKSLGLRPPSRLGSKATIETKIKMSNSQIGKHSGDKSPFWKGGIYPKHLLIRKSIEYRNWRIKVFERDDYTCQKCGIKNHKGLGKTVELQVDHIKPFYKYPELRFDLMNGRTLCKSCHRQTDTFGVNAWR